MDVNPYRSPECPDEQVQPAQPQPNSWLPDWVFSVIAIIFVIGVVVALLMPAVH